MRQESFEMIVVIFCLVRWYRGEEIPTNCWVPSSCRLKRSKLNLIPAECKNSCRSKCNIFNASLARDGIAQGSQALILWSLVVVQEASVPGPVSVGWGPMPSRRWVPTQTTMMPVFVVLVGREPGRPKPRWCRSSSSWDRQSSLKSQWIHASTACLAL